MTSIHFSRMKKNKSNHSKETQELVDVMCNWLYGKTISYNDALDIIAVASASVIGAAAVSVNLRPVSAMKDLTRMIEAYSQRIYTGKCTVKDMPN